MHNLVDSFLQFDQLLVQHRQFWQLNPMQHRDLPFADPALGTLLQSLSLADCEHLDQHPAAAAQLFGDFFPQLFRQVAPVEMLTTAPLQSPFWLSTDIGGRKWQQITLFAAAIGQSQQPVLEWCAGKGHLGRVLAQQFQAKVCSVEWQAPLCDEGRIVAARLGLTQQFICRDVLTEATADLFQPDQQVVALHACGDLHRQALHQSAAARVASVHVLPCCYHLQQAAEYQPWSDLAKRSRLRLNKAQLKLAVQEHATGGERVRRLRHTEMWWRRAYQLWRAELTGDAGYQPLRSVAKHSLNGDFRVFADWAAAQHQLSLPAGDDGSRYLTQASGLLLTQRRIELVQHLFRRPLELWLVLDRALFMQQQGYQVQLTELCQRSVTPRNLLISAWRDPATAALNSPAAD